MILRITAFFIFISLALQAADKRPNIVLILCDDMGYSDIGCYGGEIQTPNLDSLAAGGIRYSQMYNTSKCTTTRSSILTGRYVTGASTGINYVKGQTIGEVLKAAGYRTLWSGKNHSSIKPPERGFDRFYGFQGGACNFWNPGDQLQNGGKFPHIKAYEWMVDDKWLPKYIPEDPNYFMTDVITDNAVSWLKQYSGEDKPFFLFLAYNAPHWPLHAPDKDIAKYKGVYDGGYQKIRQARYKKMIDLGVIDPKTAPLYKADIADWNSVPEKEQKLEAKRMEIHAAMVDNMDQNIGRVMDLLKKQGEFENTLFLFLTDNGASHERDMRAFKNYTPTGKEKMGGVMSYECIGYNWSQVANTPLARHKTTSHEGGVNTPLIAHWPKGIKKTNSWEHQPAHLVDIMSTAIEMAGANYLEEFNGKKTMPLQGLSLVPTFSAKKLGARKTPIGYNFGRGKGVRSERWKLVSYKNGPWELYDMVNDRTETKNLADKMPEKVSEMIKLYDQWFATANQKLKTKKKKK